MTANDVYDDIGTEDDYFDPPPPSDQPDYDFHGLFEAPDFAQLVRGSRSANAKEYERKIKSVMKTGALVTARRGLIADSAAILQYGPGFSSAMGDLADANDSVARIIDLITTPESPWVVAVAVAVPFLAQLARNHEPQFSAIPEQRRIWRKRRKDAREAAKKSPQTAELSRPRFSVRIPVIGKEFGFRFKVRVPFSGTWAVIRASQTTEPQDLASKVFGDPRVQREFKKHGFRFGEPE